MLISAIVAGVVVGMLVGRRPARLAALEIRWLWLLVVAVALRLSGPFVPFEPFVLYIGSFTAILVLVAKNRHVPGVLLVGVGAASNLLVVALNGGMPLDLAAVARVGSSGLHDPLHIALEASTRLSFLSDVIPFSVGFVRNVYSIGDFFIAAGGFWIPFAQLRSS